MAKQLYYEDVDGGMAIPPLEKLATSRVLAMYCGAYEDYAEVHYDKDVAQQRGFPKPVVPGLLTSALLAQMLTNWVTPDGGIRRLKVTYRRPHYAGEKIICRGRVIAKRVDGKEHLVECEVWAENAQGEQTTPGVALIALPSRDR